MRVLTVCLSVIYFKCILLIIDNDIKRQESNPTVDYIKLKQYSTKKQDKNFNVEKRICESWLQFYSKNRTEVLVTGPMGFTLVWQSNLLYEFLC